MESSHDAWPGPLNPYESPGAVEVQENPAIMEARNANRSQIHLIVLWPAGGWAAGTLVLVTMAATDNMHWSDAAAVASVGACLMTLVAVYGNRALRATQRIMNLVELENTT